MDDLKSILLEYRRPWKIMTFLIGLGLQIVGSFIFLSAKAGKPDPSVKMRR